MTSMIVMKIRKIEYDSTVVYESFRLFFKEAKEAFMLLLWQVPYYV